MKKYLLPLILIICLAFTLIGYSANLYGTYDQRIKLTVDHTKIDSDLTWFPIMIKLTSGQMEEVFAEFDSDDDFDRCAITLADESTQIYGDCERFDDSESVAEYHVAKAGVITDADAAGYLYFYYDKDAAHNTTYISATNSEPAFTPLVTFIFDDGFETNLSIKTLFDTQGEVACAAITTDFVADEGKLTWANINTLQTGGWEIMNHGETHTDLITLNEAQIRAEFDVSQAAFVTNGITVNNLALPYTHTNDLVRSISAEYFRSARGGGSPAPNPQIIDVYSLIACSADNHTLIATFKGYVDTAKAGNRWVIFYLHETDVDDEDMLDELIDYIQAEGVDIVTVNQALNVFAPACTSVWDRNFKLVYHMADKTTSTVVDSTINSNDGTKKDVNEPIEAVGKVGQCQDYDGANDYIDCGGLVHNADNDNITVSCIMQVDNINTNYAIAGEREQAPNKGWAFYYLAGVAGDPLRFSMFGVADVPSDASGILADTWTYISFAYNKTNCIFYKDGSQLSSHLQSGAVLPATIDNLYVGAISNEGVTELSWKEYLDEVRISDVARSAAWEKATYNSLWDTLLTYGSEETPTGIVWNGVTITKWNGVTITKINGK